MVKAYAHSRAFWLSCCFVACLLAIVVCMYNRRVPKHTEEQLETRPSDLTAFLYDDGRVEWLGGKADLGNLRSNSINYRTIKIVPRRSSIYFCVDHKASAPA